MKPDFTLSLRGSYIHSAKAAEFPNNCSAAVAPRVGQLIGGSAARKLSCGIYSQYQSAAIIRYARSVAGLYLRPTVRRFR